MTDQATPRVPRQLFGFNYHPASKGCGYWRDDFPRDEIRDDLQNMASEGCNVVRAFCFWADFEPRPGEYSSAAFDHLREMARMARAEGLRFIPSIMTLWMNGQVLDLTWRHDRDLVTDPFMRTRGREYAHRVAATLGPVGNVAYYDLGDEVPNVDLIQAQRTKPEEVRHWYEEMAGAIRSADPGARVIQANEPAVLDLVPAFGPTSQHEVLDAIALHGFPLWSRLDMASADAYAASLYPAFLARLAGAFGPALVDEFAMYGMSPDVAARSVGAAAASVLATSAGLIGWCWTDIDSEDWPYVERPAERDMGFRRADGTPKDTYLSLRHAVEVASAPSFRPAPGQVGIALGADGRLTRSPRSLFGCYVALLALSLRPVFLTGLDALDRERFGLVVWPGVRTFRLDELRALEAYAASGGMVLASSSAPAPGTGGEGCFGLAAAGFGSDPRSRSVIHLESADVALSNSDRSALPFPLVEPTTAEVLGRFPSGDPALTVLEHGAGRLYFVNTSCEETAPAEPMGAPAPVELYRFVVEHAGVVPRVRAPFGLEVVPGQDGSAIVINHLPQPVTGELAFGTTAVNVSLDSKEVAVLAGDPR